MSVKRAPSSKKSFRLLPCKVTSSQGRLGRRCVALAAMLLLAAGSTTAQVPDEFENLKILPKDIDKRQLIDIMKSFCAALDVRCQYCHVGEEGMPLSEFDFVSDEREHKKITRVMMRMSDEINNRFLPETGHENPLQVRCITCHRGQSKPQTLEQVLSGVVAESGIEKALAEYKTLREKHYGSATFDFSAGTLSRLAQSLAKEEKVAEAIAFLDLNIELYPKDAMMSYYARGELQAKSGAKDKAIESFKKALELEPDNPFIKRQRDRLTGG